MSTASPYSVLTGTISAGIQSLPTEIIELIANYTDDKSLNAFTLTSRRIRQDCQYIFGTRCFNTIGVFSHPHSLNALEQLSLSPFARFVRQINFSTEQYGIVLPCQDDRAKRGLVCCTQGRVLKPASTRIAVDAELVRDALSRFPYLQHVFVGDVGEPFPRSEKRKRPIGLRQIERVAYFCPAAHPSSTEPGIARIFETVFTAIDDLVFTDFTLCVGLGLDTNLRNQASLPTGNAALLYDLPESIRYRLTHLRLAMDMTRAFTKNYLAKLIPLLRLETLEIIAPARTAYSRLSSSALDFETLFMDLHFPHLTAVKIVNGTMRSDCLVKFLRNHRLQLTQLELVQCSLVEPVQQQSGSAGGPHRIWRDAILELQRMGRLEVLTLVNLHSTKAFGGGPRGVEEMGLRVPQEGRWGCREQVDRGIRALVASY
ncbi:hypothetical protein IQ07DRAFT_224806 [Pyrenochaeta sp. DS3sAY3a]|nr:hypothetical protein IQ07DRAFT_224806 [Pyrenochaeta sp. DS3sAY3a]